MADERRNDEKGIEKAAVGGEGSGEEKKAVEEKENLCRKVYLDRSNKDEEDYVIIHTGPRAAVGGEGSSKEKEAVEEKENLCRKVYLDRVDKDEEDYVILHTGPQAYLSEFQNSKISAHYSDLQLVEEALESLKGLCTDFEIMMIGSSCPRTCEETYQLMSSLRNKRELIETPLKEVVLPTLLKLKVEIGKIKTQNLSAVSDQDPQKSKSGPTLTKKN